MKKFKIDIRNDGVVVVHIDDKRYDYYCSNVARALYLQDKLSKKPGKLFNEIKQISKEIKNDCHNDDWSAGLRKELLCETIPLGCGAHI